MRHDSDTPESTSTPAVKAVAARLRPWAILYARLALGAAFLSAVGGRFGVWDGSLDYGRFDAFIARTAEVNAFMPAFTIPFLAWAATVCESFLGVALILGLWPRWVALGSALLLTLFATAMAISLGIKAPLDSSVYSAAAGALLLALYQTDAARRPVIEAVERRGRRTVAGS